MIRFIGLILLGVVCACNDGKLRTSVKECNFEFQVEIMGPDSYNYSSRSGKLKKQIELDVNSANPYADTTLFLSTETICMLQRLCEDSKLVDLPNKIRGNTHIKPEPIYELHFTLSGKVKSIILEENATRISPSEENQFRNFLFKIDSLIISSPEFRALPPSKFIWE